MCISTFVPKMTKSGLSEFFEIHSSIYVTEFPSNKIGSFATLNCDKKTAELRHFYGRFLKSIMKLVYTRGVV